MELYTEVTIPKVNIKLRLIWQMQLCYSCCGKAFNYEINTLQVLYFTKSVFVSNTKIKFGFPESNAEARGRL